MQKIRDHNQIYIYPSQENHRHVNATLTLRIKPESEDCLLIVLKEITWLDLGLCANKCLMVILYKKNLIQYQIWSYVAHCSSSIRLSFSTPDSSRQVTGTEGFWPLMHRRLKVHSNSSLSGSCENSAWWDSLPRRDSRSSSRNEGERGARHRSTNWRLMTFSGTRSVRVMGFTETPSGSGFTSNSMRIWWEQRRREQVLTTGLNKPSSAAGVR